MSSGKTNGAKIGDCIACTNYGEQAKKEEGGGQRSTEVSGGPVVRFTRRIETETFQIRHTEAFWLSP
jgi:hypothetical protein